jgi:PAS domain-containing protein
MKLTAMRSDGTDFLVELTVTSVDLPGTPLFTGYLRDLTQEAKARVELADSEHRLQAILDNSPALVHVKDLDWRAAERARRLTL